ncbi:hypothetical protein [Telmatospirillum sp. J64-1]|uniref:Bbp19 family protein n=1 Tax=Telmatospirillum sp. J64-1 TaxID=2502183 RepID=UPI00115E30EA|nr:hypothetical protein [Telmatospirillum sp. J64-1]
MRRNDTGWDWFSAPAAPDDGPQAVAPGDIESVFARCFAGTDGERTLAHLRAMTLDRCLGPDASDAALRHLEGQRHLAAHIIALVQRGRG